MSYFRTVPYFLGKKVWGGWSVPVPSFLQNLPTVGDVLGSTMPKPVADIFDAVDDVLEWLQSTFLTDGIYVSTLDGPDKIDLSNLTGIPQTVHGDYGDDVILAGGGQDLLDTWGIPFRDQRANREIELFGDEGNDTIILNSLFDSKNTVIDGGPGSDRIVVQGTDASDIIRLIGGPDGSLEEIRLEIINSLAANPANEVQRFSMPSEVNGGTFRLQAEGWGWTGDLPWNASTNTVEQALADLATSADPLLGVADIKVTGGGGTWDIEFLNKLAGTNFTPLIVDGAKLQRSVTAPVVSVERDGGNGAGQPIANEIQQITLPEGVTGGTFTLQFDTYPETGPIAAQAGTTDITLELLRSGMSRDDFEVTGNFGGPWRIEFTGDLALTDVPQIVADGSDLWGGLEEWELVRTSPGVEQTNYTQIIDVAPEAMGGTYEVTVATGSGSHAPVNVVYNATAVELEDAIGSISGVGAGNVDVTREPDGRLRVEFINDLAGASQVAMTVDGSNLTGIDVSEKQAGTGSDNEIQQIALTGSPAGGQLRLSFDGQSTTALATSATADQVQAALEALSTIGAGNVEVTGSAGGPWDVEFIADLAKTDVAMIGAELLVETEGEAVGMDGSDEIQTLDVPAEVTAGHLNLIVRTPLGGVSTVVEYDTDAAGLQEVLEDLSVVGAGNVEVTGGSGTFQINFVNELGNSPIDPIIVDTRFLAGGGVVAVKEFSSLFVNEIQRVQIPYEDVATGTFQLELPGHGTTGDIDFGESVDDFQQLLEATFGAGNVEVTGLPRVWEIEFTGALGGQDLAELIVHGGVADIGGLAIEVTELTSGNDGENTSVLTTTRFTQLDNIELLEIAGGAGNDTLIIDNSQGPIHFRDGINFDGGAGSNRVIFTSDATVKATTSEHAAGESTMTFGPDPEDVQRVTYSSSKPYDFVPADEMRVNADSGEDVIHVEQGQYEGEKVGVIHISSGPSGLTFDGKDSLVINGGSGDDAITLNVGDLPDSVQTVTIDGQGSTSGDTLLINGTDQNDDYDFTPTSQKGGTIAVTADGTTIAVNLAGIESLSIDAMAQDAADT